MELLPSERAVLNLIRGLVFEDSQRTHSISVLRSRWPVAHDEAYTGGYLRLLDKGFISRSDDGRSFTVTEEGLDVIGFRR